MNDKKQLAAMGEHMAEQAAQPMCMAKRIEELEAQVRVMAGLLREARPYIDHRGGAGVKGYTKLTMDIDVALAGKLPDHIADVSNMVAPEGWQLMPVGPTQEMILAGVAAQAEKLKRYALGGSLHPIDHGMPDAYRAMLAAAPKPETK